MKKLFIFLLFVCLGAGGVFGYFYIKDLKEKERIEEIKKGWYVEIIHDDPINVRSIASTNGKELGKVYKGEIYKVLEINMESSAYYWYKIEFKDTEGWIASGRKIHWVNDINNPNDIATPIIKYHEEVYKVVGIDDINYKHLEIIEDTNDYEITHIIYHEVKKSQYIDQYWILYTITDGAGKSSSKLQKIEFEEEPDESEVVDFSEYR
ncbi:MAG: SH3 domain-containing protein [Firmicutes bacterium]|nr:SH3 domain-containing protein [Bacillota bacterium]